VVIVGAGLAGYSLARALRALSVDLPITMITADDGHFYSKPTLSVSTSARTSVADLISRRGAQMQQDLSCQLMARTRVTQLALAEQVVFAGQRAVPYDRLVLALGSESALPPVPGLARGPRVISVNHLDDYRQLTDKLSVGARVAVLGAGFVGAELANDFARGGYSVTLLDRAPGPLPALVPAPVGRRLSAALRGVGVTCRFGARPLNVVASNDSVRVELDGEPSLDVELLICATGLRPIPFVQTSGLAVDRGVRVSRTLQTSDPHVYALGDCANLAPFNLQFVAPIAHAAATLSRVLLGMGAELNLPPLAISVKTPCFPIVSSAGPRPAETRWQVEEDDCGITALGFDAAGELVAFALGGSHVASRSKYLSKLPPLLSAGAPKGQS
jgi:NAD(P)H-nitrite reductase large subunit